MSLLEIIPLNRSTGDTVMRCIALVAQDETFIRDLGIDVHKSHQLPPTEGVTYHMNYLTKYIESGFIFASCPNIMSHSVLVYFTH